MVLIVVFALYSSYTKPQSFLNNLKWRRAVKHFSVTGEPVDTEAIREAIVESPSSFGLQPYTVVAVENPETKKKLSAACFKQAQIEECQTLFVFCAFRRIEERMEEYLRRTKAEHIRPIMKGFFDKCPDQLAWSKNQAYIALGFALAAAAEKKITTCPMEGFIPAKVSEILQLNDDIEPCVLLAVGAAGDNSKLPPRFRFKRDELLYDVA